MAEKANSSSSANVVPFNPSDVVVKQEPSEVSVIDAFDEIMSVLEPLNTTAVVDEETKTKKKKESDKKKRKSKSASDDEGPPKKKKSKKGNTKKKSNDESDDESSKKKKSDEPTKKKKKSKKEGDDDDKKIKKDIKKKSKKDDTDDEDEKPKKNKRPSKPRVKRDKLEPFPGFKTDPGLGAGSLKCSGFKRVDPETTQQVAAEIETIQTKLQKSFEKLDSQFKGMDHGELMTFYNYVGAGDMFKEYIEFLKIQNMFPATYTAGPNNDDIVSNYNEITKSIEHSREVRDAMKQKSPATKVQTARPTTSIKVPSKQALNSQIKQTQESDSESSSNESSEYEDD